MVWVFVVNSLISFVISQKSVLVKRANMTCQRDEDGFLRNNKGDVVLDF
jgi:hypothetical protein